MLISGTGEQLDTLGTVTFTGADKDGDPATVALTLQVKDDIPTASAITDPHVLDDEGLAGGVAGGLDDAAGILTGTGGNLGYNAGADGLASITMSGPTTLGTETVTSVWSAATNTLTISSARGTLMTVIVTPSTGNYTVNLLKPLMHPAAGTEDDITLNLGYVVVDGDGDTATGSLSLTIDDDSPLVLYPETAHVEDLATVPDIQESLNFIAGADGIKTVEFNIPGFVNGMAATDLAGHDLYFNGAQLYLYYGSGGTDKTFLEAKTGQNGTVGFTIDINPLTNSYVVHSNGIISNGTETTATDLAGVGGGNVAWKALIDIGGTQEDVMMSTKTGDTVNTNHTEIGISSGNSFTYGEGIRFDFVNGLTADKDVFSYSGTHNETKAWRQEITKVTGTAANITITAILADGDNTFYGDTYGTPPADESRIVLSATDIKIYNAADQLITPDQYAGLGISVNDADPYSVTINGLRQGYTYEVTSDTAFTAIQVDAAAGTDEFKLGFFSYGENSFGTPIDLSYQIIGEDGDGDTATGYINVSLYPDGTTWSGTDGDDTHSGDAGNNVLLGSGGNDILYGLGGDDVLDGNNGNDELYGGMGNDLLTGGAGNDLLSGGDGDDFLDGGSGDDTLSGGDGADIFKASLGHDHITDYDKAAGDKVDISGLYNAGTDHLEVSDDGGNAKLSIMTDGAEKASVTFDNISYDSLGSENQLDTLLGQVDIDYDGT